MGLGGVWAMWSFPLCPTALSALRILWRVRIFSIQHVWTIPLGMHDLNCWFRESVSRSSWWDSQSTPLQTGASQMTKYPLFFNWFWVSLMHLKPWALMSHKKEEFCWVGLLDTEQSRGWKWDPALPKPKLSGGDGECLCWPSCIGLMGQGCSCIRWLLPPPCIEFRPCSGSWENSLKNLEPSVSSWGCIPH